MNYYLMKIADGKLRRVLCTRKQESTIFEHFRREKKKSNRVLFPRRFVNSWGIKPITYGLFVTKDYVEGDKLRILRDDKGKTYVEPPLSGKYTVLASAPYEMEESFWVYPYDCRNNRLTIHGIIKILMVGAYKQKMVKTIIVVNNKLVIYNEDSFEMVICKNYDDAKRLHNVLFKATKSNKIKSLLFLGTATEVTRVRLNELIHEETGWPYDKIWRTTTRP